MKKYKEIPGMYNQVELTCKDCGKKYKGTIKYMIRRGLKPGRCGVCNRKHYSQAMSRHFYIAQKKREAQAKKILDSIRRYATMVNDDKEKTDE